MVFPVLLIFFIDFVPCQNSGSLSISDMTFHTLSNVAFTYLEYQRILSVDWRNLQTVSQNGIDWVVDAITHVSSTIDASHTGSNIGIPLVLSVSAGFALGLVRG